MLETSRELPAAEITEETAMTSQSNAGNAIEVNRFLMNGGLVLLAVGGVLFVGGGVATTVAMMGAARSWIRQWDEPPSAKARRRYLQARSAAAAGAYGWKQNGHQAATVDSPA
jgi:hypothetical protein